MRKTYGAGYPDTLPALLTWSERNVTAPAVTDATMTLTWHALQDRVLRVAGGLRKAGIGAGARVALWLPNGADYLAAIFACARLGALAVHINTRFRAAEVGSLLRRTRAIALVTQWGSRRSNFQRFSPRSLRKIAPRCAVCLHRRPLSRPTRLRDCRCCRSRATWAMPGPTGRPAARRV